MRRSMRKRNEATYRVQEKRRSEDDAKRVAGDQKDAFAAKCLSDASYRHGEWPILILQIYCKL